MHLDIRLCHLHNDVAFKQSVQRIMDFPFENIILGHEQMLLETAEPDLSSVPMASY
jgi:hypothetical protein